MIQNSKTDENSKSIDWANEVDTLAEQVKMLALNLAINLARSKDNVKELTFLESDFTKLINGSVEVIKEITSIAKAFRNEGKMVYAPPNSSGNLDQIETTLNEISSLSQNVLRTISEIKKRKGHVDKFK